MEFLKDVATPQSIEHFHLLLFVLNIILIVYVPYVGFLFGSAFVSVSLERRYRRMGTGLARQVAGDLITTALQDRKVVMFMGIVPSLALVFVLTQLLQGTPAMSVALSALSSLFLVAGAGFLLVFRFTFRLRRILESAGPVRKGGSPGDGSAGLENDARQMSTGRFGLISLALSVFLLGGSLALSANPEQWAQVDGLVSLVFSADVLLKFVHLLAIAAGVTGAGILFYLDRPGAGEEYQLFVRRLGSQLAVASILLQPVLVILTIALMPKSVLSGTLFGIGGASLIAFLLAGICVYGISREPGRRFATLAFVTFVVAVAFLMTNEQVAVHNATQRHAVVLALEYEKVNEAFKASLGISTVSFTGEDIYNGRCSPCHLADTRKVGPPFTLVAAKYSGKREALISFIRKPVKVDPAYPPMPNQGLRPAEADSVASFLLRRFGPESSSSSQAPPSE